jgi:monofunctional biosynthetic peptidoglycan transglycosylase
MGLIASGIGYILLSTPRPSNIRDCITTEMFHVRLCPQDSSYVKLKNISPNLKNAVIASEDGAFYSHQGIDWFEMRESFEKDWEKGEFARGGSTLTQQLAKNVYLNQEKSMLRKLHEAIIALQLEGILSKDEILEKYLNVVQFGEKLYGAGPASRHYFAKPPSELDVAESAFLAFLLPSPERYSTSFKHKKLTSFARSQMREIVGRMYRYKKISDDQHQEALNEIDHFFGPPSAGLDLGNIENSKPSSEEQPPNAEDLL